MEEMQPPPYEDCFEAKPSAPIDYSKEEICQPPPSPPIQYDVQRPPMLNLGYLVEEQIRDCCYEYVAEHCCYGSKFVEQMKVTDILHTYCYHYRLESFGEKRQSASRYDSYHGQPIDPPGVSPLPWDMAVSPTQSFKDGRTTREIPHTAYIKTCFNCSGSGNVDCSSCSGNGQESCSSCSFGTNSDGETCGSCGGSGRTTCWSCNGSGRQTCSTCDGHGRLKHYKILIVTWKNHVEDYFTDSSALPMKLIPDAKGREVFQEEKTQLSPVTHAPQMEINMASRRMIERHVTAFPDELIINQRHNLRAVPITKVAYKWKRKEGDFFVYGFQNKVYFENYPQKCCCCTCL